MQTHDSSETPKGVARPTIHLHFVEIENTGEQTSPHSWRFNPYKSSNNLLNGKEPSITIIYLFLSFDFFLDVTIMIISHLDTEVFQKSLGNRPIIITHVKISGY